MFFETEVNKHKDVGPYEDMYDHTLVMVIQDPDDRQDTIFACLNCGYTHNDNRMFAHEECNRDDNGINETFSEFEDRKAVEFIDKKLKEEKEE